MVPTSTGYDCRYGSKHWLNLQLRLRVNTFAVVSSLIYKWNNVHPASDFILGAFKVGGSLEKIKCGFFIYVLREKLSIFEFDMFSCIYLIISRLYMLTDKKNTTNLSKPRRKKNKTKCGISVIKQTS